MTTAGDLIDRAIPFARDSGGNFQTEELFIGWLNEAQTDVAARSQLLEQEETSSTDGTNSIALPTEPELVEVLECLLGDDDDRVQFTDTVNFNANVDGDSTPSMTIGRIFDDHIEFYPTPDEDTAVTLRYKRFPTPIVAADNEIEMPSQVQRKLVEYMKAQSRFLDGDFQAGNNWLGLYEQGLASPSLGRERLTPGAPHLSRRPNVWDRQVGARHV